MGHPKCNVAYCVNELSSTVAVFSIDREALAEISHAAKLGLPMDKFKGRSTIKLIQSIKTVPTAFPTTMNTCGRICCCAMVDRYLDDNDNQPYDTFGHIVPSSVVFDQTKKDSVDSELEAARAEIVELKKKLSRVAQVA